MEDPASTGDPLSLFLNFLFLVLLIYLSGLFSGSETALTSVSRLRLRKLLKEEKDKSMRQILQASLEKPNKMLTAILIMNNLVNILASSVATLLVLRVLPEGAQSTAAAIVTGVMTFLILVFGEITPKIHARENAEKVFRRIISFISFVTKVLTPVIWILMNISNALIVLRGGKKVRETPFITEDEIISAVDVGHEEGVLLPEERRMMKMSLELKGTSVKEIMTPRVEIVCIEEDAVIRDLLNLVHEEGYSRIPVYRENIDRIVGVCYAKDIIGYIAERKDPERILDTIPVKEIMRVPFFIPETKKIHDLMKEFKQKKIHLAIVVDEYGGTAGLVSMEDILEEFTGEILDEYDVESEEITIEKIDESTYIIDGMTPINDIERELDIKFPETEFETVGGYLLEILERFPDVGEIIHIDGFNFEIIAIGKNRIEKIKLTVERRKKNVDQKREKTAD
ncbi:MAG: HlyC/CorC family transporter [Thermotogae bacterium]|uniref:hemolysin family protein n=1 Tax=Kosmotoga sp. TaxID=1955248 RepID=UPI000F137F70|nr:hemolysin family protein [Kosmotoga sp.]MBO8165914.1 HlyC/CorC family transporter [Kosmotoga sp.]MCD6159653.1 HlyC/CorC family transporter [Kosmotoga sp.]RKX50362.1 MAG: HlyC/CorC family transporter [Thermotogota bacterium]